jgi:mono/diheme cytochrome c family protein
MKQKNHLIKFAFSCVFAVSISSIVTSCGKKDPNSPGVEFMPDMYRSPSLEVYNSQVIDGDTVNSMSERLLPVKGSVSRGYIPYAYSDTPEGYEQAGTYLHNPLGDREKNEKEGEVLYGKFCIHCHGAAGGGDGKVAQKLPGAPPAYNGTLKNLPEGKIFHSITYGKNLMGAHASQLTQEERWKLVYYVQKLQGPKETTTDSTKTIAAVVIPSKK